MIRVAGNYSLVMLSFVLIVAILLIEWQISVEIITPQAIFFVGYLLLLNEFNDMTVTKSVILVVCIYLLERIVVFSSNNLNLSLIMGISCLVVIGGISLTTQTSLARKTLTEISVPLRQYLTEQGLYSYINERKYQFMAKTGFSEDDSLLGGPIRDDQAIVFHVKQKEPRYWRVDSKTEYTGKGWKSSEERVEIEPTEYLYVADNDYKGLYEEPENVEIKLYYDGTYLPISYGKVEKNEFQEGLSFKYNEHSGRVDLNAPLRNEDIELSIASPKFEEKELQKAQLIVPDKKYIQLPKKFPTRIKDLTEEITKDKVSVYDKVKAVEQHLKTSSEYSYSKSGARHTPDDTDYVDFFLFESKQGYCNNFSTSMSVMLRSIGIPTRWVKGFNQGEVKEKDGDMSVYNIRNSNAHSWVEVYFEGSGWVPFEPTPTFTNTSAVESDTKDKPASPTEENKKTSQSSKETKGSSSQNSSKKSQNNESFVDKLEEIFSDNKRIIKLLLQSIGVIILLLLFAYLKKNKYYLMILVSLNLLKYPFTKIYQILLKQIQSKIYREPSLTLTQYTISVCQKFPELKELEELTKQYEQTIYGGVKEQNLTEEMKKSIITLSKSMTTIKMNT